MRHEAGGVKYGTEHRAQSADHRAQSKKFPSLEGPGE